MIDSKDIMHLGELTQEEARYLLENTKTAILLPVGSVEPHGPHLPLDTDLKISEKVCELSVAPLGDNGIAAVIAPGIPFGVTNFAEGFKGRVSVGQGALSVFLNSVINGFLEDGWSHVSVINNHLEPTHVKAIADAVSLCPPGCASAPSVLTPMWGARLSDEFRSGACHAGQYETSMMLAIGGQVRPAYKTLPPLDVSLSQGIKEGKDSFFKMGMNSAYTGNPAGATEAEGQSLLKVLVEMVVNEITEAVE